MGYGIICWLDDRNARALDAAGNAAHIGVALRDLLGSYRHVGAIPPRRNELWHVAGSHHSATTARYAATADGLVALDPAFDSDDRTVIVDATGLTGDELVADDLASGDLVRCDSVWVDTLRGADHLRAQRDLHRHPQKLAALRTHGGGAADALLGPRDAIRASVGSAWWFHADAIRHLTDRNTATLGRAVAALLATHWDGTVAVGSRADALNRAGTLCAPGTVALVWSNNRLRRPALLTGTEKRDLAAHLGV